MGALYHRNEVDAVWAPPLAVLRVLAEFLMLESSLAHSLPAALDV